MGELITIACPVCDHVAIMQIEPTLECRNCGSTFEPELGEEEED